MYTRITSLVFIALTLLGCSDDPSSIGSSLLPSGDYPNITVDTLYATAHASPYALPTTRSSDRILLGNTGSIQAWSMLQFLGLPDSLSTITITRAWVEVSTSYHYGDSLAPVSFTIHRGTGSWLGDSLTCDSLISQPSSYFDPVPFASISSGAVPDTGWFRFEIPDTALIHQWIAASSDTNATNLGIILKPTNSSVVKGFWSFNSLETTLAPKLILECQIDGATVEYSHQSGTARYCATAPEGTILLDPSRIYVQSGIAYRGLVTFDVSSIRRGVVINRALLELTLDASASDRTGLVPDSLYAYYVSETGAIVAESYRLSGGGTLNNERFYQFDARDYVQQWLAYPALPKQVTVTAVSELGTLDRFVFYGSEAPIHLRPRLRVTYSSIHQ